MANKYHSIEINYVVTEKTNDDNDNASVKKENKSGETNDKEEVQFHETKVAFVAGIIVIITSIIETLKLVITIPNWVNLAVFIIGLVIFVFSLGSSKTDGDFKNNIVGVERFGSVLSVYSIVFVLLQKILEFEKDEECLNALTVFALLSAFVLAGIVESIRVLCSGKSKKEHKE